MVVGTAMTVVILSVGNYMSFKKYSSPDLTNQVFGKWVVLEFSHYASNMATYWKCKCSCGSVYSIRGTSLRQGKSSSCKSCSKITHGLTGTPFFDLWVHINDRCTNSKNDRYKDYGGRGIFVCDSWKDPLVFIEWCGTQNYCQGMKIERMDNNGPYSPENCKFATDKEQSMNKRDTVFVTVFGETLTLIEAVDKFSLLSLHTVRCRLLRGWNIQDALQVQKYKHSKC